MAEKTMPARVWVVYSNVYGMDDKPIAMFRHRDERTAREYAARSGGYVVSEIRVIERPSVVCP